jgi:hypothetical protein
LLKIDGCETRHKNMLEICTIRDTRKSSQKIYIAATRTMLTRRVVVSLIVCVHPLKIKSKIHILNTACTTYYIDVPTRLLLKEQENYYIMMKKPKTQIRRQ